MGAYTLIYMTTEQEFNDMIDSLRALEQKQKMTVLANLSDSIEMFFKVVKHEEEHGEGSAGADYGVAYWQKSVEFWINYYNR